MKNTKLDDYFGKESKWKNEINQLRSFLLDCGLREELKWRQPCYVYNGSNIVLIGAFKNYVTLSFFKGVLLKDKEKHLELPGENSQSVMMYKFTDFKEIIKQEKTIKAYIFEAIEIKRLGLKVELKKSSELELIEELEENLNQDSDFKKAFFALTPGRQRAYNIHYSSAKQVKTRISRIEKTKQRILNGYGLNDCTCGLSKRKPNCDGSHKSHA